MSFAPVSGALACRRVSSPVGELTLVASDVGLRAVVFAGDAASGIDIGNGVPSSRAIRTVDLAEAELGQYFAKELTVFTVALDLVGTEFQVTVWESLREVAFGETTTYRTQAQRLGLVDGARAVGAANAKNPVPIVLGCHRVIAADGALTGYVGGLAAKGYLLRHEEQRQPSLFD